MIHKSTALAEPLAARMHFKSRAAQTAAICSSDFAWMQNSKGVAPCSLAASVDAPCFNGDYTVSALPPNTSYSNPTTQNREANPCTCSWASYNLLSACVICQGISQEVPQWPVYSFGCSGLLSNSFLPLSITFPEGLVIPAWAETNPTTWDGETFNVGQAKPIADQGEPGFVTGGPAAQQHKKSNNGPIIGGVIGGIAVLVLMALIATWMIRRWRTQPISPSTTSFVPGHKSNYSDTSYLAQRPEIYSPALSHLQFNPTLNSSVRSFARGTGTVPTSQTQSIASSQAPGAGRSVQQTTSTSASSDPKRVTPFPFSTVVNAGHAGQKQSIDSQPTYGHPSNTQKIPADSTRQHAHRPRVNPPAYATPAPGQPRQAKKQPSTDTQHSLTSSQRVRAPDIYGHSPSASGSGTESLIPPTNSDPVPTYGRTLSGNSRDEKRSNTITKLEYSASDIA